MCWKAGSTKQLSFCPSLLMVLLANSLLRASISSAEGRTQSHSSPDSPLRDPVYFPPLWLVSISYRPTSLKWASGGLLAIWSGLFWSQTAYVHRRKIYGAFLSAITEGFLFEVSHIYLKTKRHLYFLCSVLVVVNVNTHWFLGRCQDRAHEPGVHRPHRKWGFQGVFPPHFLLPRLRWRVETGHCGKYFTQTDKAMYI